ncbi:MAG TPA: peptide ABC transporter substrate-binding protein [Candidatus Dormibacteraeota bacterium]|nr:peptide ABC transporter substrate-binding protein [Candidatus Dormibacteraeota bacterium]
MKGVSGRLRWLPITAVSSMAAVLVAACGASGNNGTSGMAPNGQQILRTNSSTEPNSFDPGQTTYDYEGMIVRNVFEPLLKPKPDLSDVEGAAASSYDVSSDGLTYTFHIRQNAKWSDGQPLKAQDFVYGFQRLLDPSLASGYADPFFDLTIAGGANYSNVDPKNASAVQSFIQGLGLSAKDDHTFVVKLAAPAGYFKWVVTLAQAAPIRKDLVGSNYTSWASDPTRVVGNGMFKISEEVAKDHVTMVPNPNYWGDKPHIQKWIDYFIADANQAFSKYQTGELDMLQVPLANQDTVNSDPKLKAEQHKYPSLGTFWMAPNIQVSPFNNVHVREAIAHAVDRNILVNSVAKGQYVARTTYIPEGMNGYTPSLGSVQDYDPAKGRAALQASGLPTSAYDHVKLLTRATTTNQLVNQYVLNQINTNLGVHWTLEVVDSKTVTSRIRRGNFQIYGPDGWGADYPDEQDFFDVFTTGGCHGLNWGCPNDKAYDDLVSKGDAALKQSDRQKYYDQAAKMMEDQFWVAFLYNRYDVTLVKPYVKGITSTGIDESNYIPGDFNTNTIFIASH